MSSSYTESSSIKEGFDTTSFADGSKPHSILPSPNTTSTLVSSQVIVDADSNLPPMDRGFHAYSYVAAGFVIELLVWSLPFSYGVFLNHYTTHHLFDHSENLLPLVGTLSSGIMYAASLFVVPLLARYPRYRKSLMYAGLLCCVSSLLGAAFSTQVWHLILTQGVLYSIGGTLVYFPMSVSVFEWFDENRGLANGIMYSGTYLGGIVMPFIVQVLLNKFGLRVTFISLGIAYGGFICAVLPFVKSRLPASDIITPDESDWSFLRNPKFIILVSSNFLQGLGNSIPPLWLPTFATDLNMSVTSGTLIISVMNGSSMPGSIVLGRLADKCDLRLIILVSTIGSSLAALLLWGLASTLPPLLLFAVVYGFLAAPFSSLWPKFCSVSSNKPQHAARLMGIFIASRGVGNILTGPISTGLLRMTFIGARDSPKYGIQLKSYGPLIVFTGVAMFLSIIGVLYNSMGGGVTIQDREKADPK